MSRRDCQNIYTEQGPGPVFGPRGCQVETGSHCVDDRNTEIDGDGNVLMQHVLARVARRHGKSRLSG